MKNSFSHIFYSRKSTTKDNTGTIYLRVTVNGKRAVTTTGREVLNSIWNVNAGKAIGNSSQAKQINRFLSKIENDVYAAYQKLLDRGDLFSSRDILDVYLGKDKEKENNGKMLLEIFQEHKDRVNKLVGKDFAAGTA